MEFIFRKTPCFHHILMNNFRRMYLKHENFSFRGISDISDLQTTFRLKTFYCKNCQWKYIKNESDKCYLDNKKQKAMFLVAFLFCFFFLSGFSLTTIHELQDCRGRGRAFI